MHDQKGEVQYFIGVQLDGSEHVKPLTNKIPEKTEQEGALLVCYLALCSETHKVWSLFIQLFYF